MAPRKPPARKSEQHELDAFAEKYETYAMTYGDPIEVVFSIMANHDSPDELKLQAATSLMGFRYPKLKALENKNPQQGQPLTFNITLTQGVKKTDTVDVTPPKLTLAGGSK